MNLKIKKVETIQEFIDTIRIRVDVFIKEQGCPPGWEPDVQDKEAIHYIALIDNKIVSTARVLKTDNNFKIERMATIKEFRKKGIGKGLVDYIIKDLKPNKIWMQSQLQAKEFYEKCGFKVISKPYDHYGKEHIDMELK